MKILKSTRSKRRKATGGDNKKASSRSKASAEMTHRKGNGNGNGAKTAQPAAAAEAIPGLPSCNVLAGLADTLSKLEAKLAPSQRAYGSGKRFDALIHYAASAVPPITPGSAIAVLDVRRRTDLALGSFAYEIIANLDGNLYLPSPEPTIAQLTAANKAFTDAITARDAGVEQLKSLTQIKDQFRAVLENLLKNLQMNVQTVSQGDAAVITSLGLPVKRRGSRGGELSFPTGVTVNPGPVTGTLIISWDVVKGSKGYLVQCSPDLNPRQWSLVKRSGKRSLLIEGLEPGKTYVFQVAAAGGASGQSLWSPEVIRVCA